MRPIKTLRHCFARGDSIHIDDMLKLMWRTKRSHDWGEKKNVLIQQSGHIRSFPPLKSSLIFIAWMSLREGRQFLSSVLWHQSIDKCVLQPDQECGHNHKLHSPNCMLNLPFPQLLLYFVFFPCRQFLMYLQRYKSFFAALPEMLCEGENVVDDSTCWSGDDVVER